MAVERTDIQYRGHRIIANQTGAMVYLPSSKHPIQGENLEDNLAQAKAFIDKNFAQRIKKRRAPQIGTVDDYCEALASLKLGAHERAMLSAHCKADQMKLTATELSDSAGWDGASPANSHYGRLGKRVAEHISLDITGRDDLAWTTALASFDEETRQWEMHSELAEALVRLNMR